jgi:hypothetical protein
MAETKRLTLEKVELIADKDDKVTIRVLEDRLEDLLNKCPIMVSGAGEVIMYGNPSFFNLLYLSPKEGTEIVEVQKPQDITKGNVKKINLKKYFRINVGRTSQELDSPFIAYMKYNKNRIISTIPIKGIVPPSNY